MVFRRLANGGMERVALFQATALAAAGFETAVLTLEDPGPLAERFGRGGIEVEALGGSLGTGLATGMHGLALLPRVRSFLASRRPRLVQTHMRTTGFTARPVALGLGIPVLVALHNQDPRLPAPLAGLESGLDRASAFLAVSRAVSRHAVQVRGVPASRISLVPNPLPPGNPAARPTGRGPRPILGFLGKLEAKKDPLRFLALARALRTRIPGLRIRIGGTGPLQPQLAEAAAGDPGIELVGEVEDGFGFLAGLDLACFPSRREGFGLAVGEALAAGTPVLVSDLEPFREVYGRLPESCFLPGSATPEQGAERLHALLSDPELRNRAGAAATGILAAFSPERSAEAYLAAVGTWLARPTLARAAGG